MKTISWKRPFRIAATVLVFLTWAGAPVAVAQTDVTYFSRFKEMYAVKRANVRSGPGTNFAKVGLLDIDQKVRVTAQRGDWFKLTGLPKQPSRFVYAPLLTEVNPLALTGRATTTAPSKRTIKYGNGASYHGQTRNGRPHGHGVYTQTDGYRHEGEYRDGLFHGHGVVVYSDGARYEGDFVNGKETGRGVLTWSVFTTDGTRHDGRYMGDFVDGQFHGRGVITWQNLGDRSVTVEEGHWSDGKRHGKGWEIQATDGTGFQAIWTNGEVGRKDYRRQVWESDRLRWLRESGLETQTASTEQKPKTRSSRREAGNNQASPGAKELWGVFVLAWYKREAYSIVWNASSPETALRKALELCQSKVGIPCWPPRDLEWDRPGGGIQQAFMPRLVHFFSTSSSNNLPLEELAGDELAERGRAADITSRCVLVFDFYKNQEQYDASYHPRYDDSEENARRNFYEEVHDEKRSALHPEEVSDEIEFIACNDF